MATTITNQIALDGTFSDWPAADLLTAWENSGYQLYGALVDDETLGETYVIGIDATDPTDAAIAAGTALYLNTDRDHTSGYSPYSDLGVEFGAEFEVQFLVAGGAYLPYLFSVTPSGVTTSLNGGAPIPYGFSSDGRSVELAIPKSLLAPAEGVAPTAIDFDLLINNAMALPPLVAPALPEFVIQDVAAAPAPTTIASTITLDGTFADWPGQDSVTTRANAVSGYQVYGAFLDDAVLGATYVIGIDATGPTDLPIEAGATRDSSTTIYLNTDLNTATGYSPFGKIGAEYEVVFEYGTNSLLEPFLYSVTSTGATTLLNRGMPLAYGFSGDGKSVELAIPQALLAPAGGTGPRSVDFAALIDNATGLPGDFAHNPEYVITDPAALAPTRSVKKVGIVYSATSAAFFDGGGPSGETAYADLFMDAQQQARAAGVPYDLLTEADLADADRLSQYSALIFPDYQYVQSSQFFAVESALYQAVYGFHVPIITSGNFMTDDENGNPMANNAYASMQTLLGLTFSGYGTATYSLVPDPAALSAGAPILAGYAPGQAIGGASGVFTGATQGVYTNAGYSAFSGLAATTTIADIDIEGGSSIPGVMQSTTGGTNTEFATTGLFGDSNLLQRVIQNAVFGATPSLAMDITRFRGVVNSRTDMDESQFPLMVDPSANGYPGPGVYDEMIPILQQLKNQYSFVGSYFINIGDNANPAVINNSTDWSVSLPYYDKLLQMGNEIGDHSYTHLVNPPTVTVTATTTSNTPANAIDVQVSDLPTYNGSTLGLLLTGITAPTGADLGAGIGANTYVSATSGDAASGYGLTLVYAPDGYGTTNDGVLGAIPSGSTLTFSVPSLNTNFLSASGTGPFTYAYEFGTSKSLESSSIGIAVAGAAVPGANDALPDSQQILSYFPSAAGVTGYVTGGWTGVGAGFPNAFGYATPSDASSVYIAPNISFDFSELQYRGDSPQSALASWKSLFDQLSANSGTPVIVWPWHDYGVTDYPTAGPGTAAPGYTAALYTDFIRYAFDAGYEFVTSEDLAQRIAAEQAATLSETSSGNVITATVTPGASQSDLGAMALNVINGAAGQVIQNAGSWYAYDADSVFLADDTVTTGSPPPETFTVTLGTTPDDLTHVVSLPMRADLQSVTGDGSNLTFSFTGDGTVGIHIKTPTAGAGVVSVQQSITGTAGADALAPTATLIGDDLELTFNDGAYAISPTSPQGVPVEHTVTITEAAAAVAGATFVFAAPTVAIASAGGPTNQATQTITGTVTEPMASQVVGTTVSLYDNGATVAFGTATVQAGIAGVADGLPTWTATVTLSEGSNSIAASDTDASGATGTSGPVTFTLDAQAPTVASASAGGATDQAMPSASADLFSVAAYQSAQPEYPTTDAFLTASIGSYAAAGNPAP